MKIGIVLRDLHRSETRLGRDLLRIREKHRSDHEIYHVAQDLAVWSQQHADAIAEAMPADDLDSETDPGAGTDGGGPMNDADDPGLTLLRDLRSIYLDASGVFADWELVAQAAQGARLTDLLDLAEACLPETERQLRWANAKLKESSTQILIS